MAIIKSPNVKAQLKLVQYVKDILTGHRERHELNAKMQAIDIAYARYKEYTGSKADNQGVDADTYAEFQAEFQRAENNFIDIDVPLVASQVDTFVAYAAEIYLSGTPTFGIVTDPKNAKTGEYVEALIDKHATISKYTRELQLFFRDCGKYNVAGLIMEWDTIQHYQRTAEQEVVVNQKPSISSVEVGFNKMERVDPYNLIFDDSVLPGMVAAQGDFAGRVELKTLQQLRRLIAKLKRADRGHLVNDAQVLSRPHPTDKSYQSSPQISRYITKRPGEFDWYEWAMASKSKKHETNYGSKFEVTTIFGRLYTDDFDLKLDLANADDGKEGIFKLIVVNGDTLLYIERMYTAFDHLPILIGQPKEDGLGLQTHTIAEDTLPMQQAASGLVNIRFEAGRRTIADRAIYDENMIDPIEVNNPSPSAKIPAKTNALAANSLQNAYYSIPYNDQSSRGLIGDALTMSDWTGDLAGFNRASRGSFTPGNRTVSEFSDIQSNADQRQRLPIIVLEHQVFAPLKQLILLNILRYASGEVVQAAASGSDLSVDVNTLTNTTLDFKVADGYQPKSKLANTDLLTAFMTQIGTNQVLAQSYGNALPAMFAHLAQLGGLKGLDQYTPTVQQIPAQAAGQSEGAPSDVTQSAGQTPTP